MESILWVGYPRSYTPGRLRKPQYVVLHYTAGHEGPTDAENGAKYDKIRTDGTSTHYFTDSLGPAIQEVPEKDRAHAARRKGNEIGIQIEICGTRQTRAQWLDATSRATLETTAWLVANICKRNRFPVKLLTVAETRAAYFAEEGKRPFGITDHSRVTRAYPEDQGDHMDVGTEFPWDIFLEMVRSELNLPNPTPIPKPTPREYDMLILARAMPSANVAEDVYLLGDGYYHRELSKDEAADLLTALRILYVNPELGFMQWPGKSVEEVKMRIGLTPHTESTGDGGAVAHVHNFAGASGPAVPGE